MMTRRPLPKLFDVPGELERIRAELGTLQQSGRMAPNTEYGYAHDFRAFSAWCLQMELCALPATSDTLSLFLTDQLNHKKVSSVCRYANGVAWAHRRQGLESPVTRSVKDLLWAARRRKNEQPRQMIPLSVDQVREMARMCVREATPAAARNACLLLLGFSSALRCLNLSLLRLEDITFHEQGIEICVRQEKNNQAGQARFIAIPFGHDPECCPVKSLNVWLAHRGLESGPLFTRLDTGRERMTGCTRLETQAIRRIVKIAVGKIGVDPSQYGPHSLRAGMITAAGESGLNDLVIAAHSGHHSLENLRRYFRPRDRFKAGANAAAATGL